MDGVTETDDISVSFQDWTIGDSEKGISGVLDAFEVYRPSSNASPSKALPVYVWVIICLVILSVIFLIYFFIYPRYCAKGTKADKAIPGIELNSYSATNEPVPAIPAKTNMTPPKPDFAPPRPTGRTSGRRAPPRPKNRPTSGSRNSGGGLNLGLSPQERMESWKV